jgi:tetratricopeptide (TPR) repeat protein
MISRFVLVCIWVCISSVNLGANNVLTDSLLNRLPNTSDEEKATTYLHISEAFRLTDLSLSIIYGDSAVSWAHESGDETLKADILKSLGVSCYYNGEFDLAIDYYNQSMEAYRLIDNLSGIARCLNNIGLVYEELGNFELSIDYFERSGEIGKQMNDQEWIAFVMLNLGNSHFYRGNMQLAINNYYHALLIFTDMDDKNSIGEACNNIGSVYNAWGESEKALEYFERAREIYKITGDDRNLSKVLSNIAEIYNFYYKDYIKAKKLYEESLEIKIKLNDLIGIAMQNNNMGTLYANMEEFDKAQKYFVISMNLYQEMASQTGLVMVYYNMGKLYEQMQKTSEALDYYKMSLNIARKIGQSDYIADNHEALFKCYAALGDYPNFNKHYKMFEIGNDTLVENLHRSQMLEMEARFKVEQVVQQNMKLTEELHTMKSKVQKYRLISFAFGGIIVFTLIFYFLYVIFRK